MKKSNIFYFVALAISLTAYIGIFFNFINLQNLSKVQEININGKNINLTIIIITIPLFVLSIIQMVKSLKEEKQVSKKAIMFLMIKH